MQQSINLKGRILTERQDSPKDGDIPKSKWQLVLPLFVTLQFLEKKSQPVLIIFAFKMSY